MQKRWLGGLAILCAAAVILGAAGQVFLYPVTPDPETLPGQIQAQLEAPYRRQGVAYEVPTVQVCGSVSIGSRIYCLIETGDLLGSVTLERGLTGRCRFTHLQTVDGGLMDGIVESGGQSWLILGGRDTARRIASIAAEVEGVVYTLEKDPAANRFLVYTALSGHIADNHIDRDRLHFYDAAGRDITADYDLSGGGIQ